MPHSLVPAYLTCIALLVVSSIVDMFAIVSLHARRKYASPSHVPISTVNVPQEVFPINAGILTRTTQVRAPPLAGRRCKKPCPGTPSPPYHLTHIFRQKSSALRHLGKVQLPRGCFQARPTGAPLRWPEAIKVRSRRHARSMTWKRQLEDILCPNQ